jgi:hypothetical protein
MVASHSGGSGSFLCRRRMSGGVAMRHVECCRDVNEKSGGTQTVEACLHTGEAPSDHARDGGIIWMLRIGPTANQIGFERTDRACVVIAAHTRHGTQHMYNTK